MNNNEYVSDINSQREWKHHKFLKTQSYLLTEEIDHLLIWTPTNLYEKDDGLSQGEQSLYEKRPIAERN